MHDICITYNWTIKIVNKYWLEAATMKNRLTAAYSKYDKIHGWYSYCWKSFVPSHVISTMIHFYHDNEEALGIQTSIITSIPKEANKIFHMSLVSRKGWKLIIIFLFPLCLSFSLCTTWKTGSSLNTLVHFWYKHT